MGQTAIIKFPETTQPAVAPKQLSTSAVRRLRLLPIQKDGPGMGSDYSLRLASRNIARIRLEQKGPRHYWIDWVYVPPSYRGTGIGRRLMRAVLEDADARGIRLSLEARACATLSQEQLESWYRGFGFVPSGERGTFGPIMVRRPVRSAGFRRVA